MRVWRAYGIGKEKFVSRSDFENLENFSLPHLTVVKDALHPKQCFSPTKERKTTKRGNAASNQGLELKESDVEDHDNHVDLFPCPEEGSIRRYQGHSSLQSHLGVSMHKYALKLETLQDKAMQQYAQKSSVESEYLDSTSGAPSSLSAPSQGWALKCAVTNHRRLTKEQRKYLTYLLLIGEQTGRNLSPDEVSMAMRKARGPDGVCLFSADNYPSPKQMASFTSRLAKMSALGMAVILSEEDENDNSTNRLPQKTSQVTGSCVYQAPHYARNVQHLQNGQSFIVVKVFSSYFKGNL